MTLSRTYRSFAVIITALFLLLQGVSLSHAASYGSEPHEHDGVICVVSLQDEAQAIVPPPVEMPEAPALQSRIDAPYEVYFDSAPTRHYRGREPPPRGPPSK